MEGAPPKKETGGSTVLKLVLGGNLLYFPGPISNRTKPGNSEFALRVFPGCKFVQDFTPEQILPYSGHLQSIYIYMAQKCAGFACHIWEIVRRCSRTEGAPPEP